MLVALTITLLGVTRPERIWSTPFPHRYPENASLDVSGGEENSAACAWSFVGEGQEVFLLITQLRIVVRVEGEHFWRGHDWSSRKNIASILHSRTLSTNQHGRVPTGFRVTSYSLDAGKKLHTFKLDINRGSPSNNESELVQADRRVGEVLVVNRSVPVEGRWRRDSKLFLDIRNGKLLHKSPIGSPGYPGALIWDGRKRRLWEQDDFQPSGYPTGGYGISDRRLLGESKPGSFQPKTLGEITPVIQHCDGVVGDPDVGSFVLVMATNRDRVYIPFTQAGKRVGKPLELVSDVSGRGILGRYGSYPNEQGDSYLDGPLSCVDPTSGKVRWSTPVKGWAKWRGADVFVRSGKGSYDQDWIVLDGRTGRRKGLVTWPAKRRLLHWSGDKVVMIAGGTRPSIEVYRLPTLR